MVGITTVRVTKVLHGRLCSLKVIPQEPLDSVLCRLVDFWEENNGGGV